ncbi:flagellin [Halarsenatibacter silvermanii]|uniref:Flagellin n=1 Tax=Halarsenatibacter silvermanii TaxID=321763 RepID=A0A1G9M3M7_9FIRM|nr:flagellin [Halarsenatibacter silvermanii]SDL68561.1 flagellin C-terminal helical region [Halarsenatibacter silvermanii]
MRINHNHISVQANNRLRKNNSAIRNNSESLASGKRINRAADDPAGLGISQRMEARNRGLEQNRQNIQDGKSLLDTADGAVGQMQDKAQRMRELTIQAANGTLTDSEQESIKEEMRSLEAEMSRTSKQTEFNEIPIIDGSLSQKTEDVEGEKETGLDVPDDGNFYSQELEVGEFTVEYRFQRDVDEEGNDILNIELWSEGTRLARDELIQDPIEGEAAAGDPEELNFNDELDSLFTGGADVVDFVPGDGDNTFMAVGTAETDEGEGEEHIFAAEFAFEDGELEVQWEDSYRYEEDLRAEGISIDRLDQEGNEFIISGQTGSEDGDGEVILMKVERDNESIFLDDDFEFEEIIGSNDDFGRSIEGLEGGGKILAASVEAAHGNKDLLVLKLNEDGIYEWEQRIEDSDSDDIVWDIEETSDGDFVIAGESEGAAALHKMSSEGEILSTHTEDSLDHFIDIEEDAEGNIIAAGYDGNDGLEVKKFADNGNELEEEDSNNIDAAPEYSDFTDIDENHDFSLEVVEGPDGDPDEEAYIISASANENDGSREMKTVKLDEDFEEEWDSTELDSGSHGNKMSEISPNSDGGYLAFNPEENEDELENTIAHFDSQGVYQWEKDLTEVFEEVDSGDLNIEEVAAAGDSYLVLIEDEESSDLYAAEIDTDGDINQEEFQLEEVNGEDFSQLQLLDQGEDGFAVITEENDMEELSIHVYEDGGHEDEYTGFSDLDYDVEEINGITRTEEGIAAAGKTGDGSAIEVSAEGRDVYENITVGFEESDEEGVSFEDDELTVGLKEDEIYGVEDVEDVFDEHVENEEVITYFEGGDFEDIISNQNGDDFDNEASVNNLDFEADDEINFLDLENFEEEIELSGGESPERASADDTLTDDIEVTLSVDEDEYDDHSDEYDELEITFEAGDEEDLDISSENDQTDVTITLEDEEVYSEGDIDDILHGEANDDDELPDEVDLENINFEFDGDLLAQNLEGEEFDLDDEETVRDIDQDIDVEILGGDTDDYETIEEYNIDIEFEEDEDVDMGEETGNYEDDTLTVNIAESEQYNSENLKDAIENAVEDAKDGNGELEDIEGENFAVDFEFADADNDADSVNISSGGLDNSDFDLTGADEGEEAEGEEDVNDTTLTITGGRHEDYDDITIDFEVTDDLDPGETDYDIENNNLTIRIGEELKLDEFDIEKSDDSIDFEMAGRSWDGKEITLDEENGDEYSGESEEFGGMWLAELESENNGINTTLEKIFGDDGGLQLQSRSDGFIATGRTDGDNPRVLMVDDDLNVDHDSVDDNGNIKLTEILDDNGGFIVAGKDENDAAVMDRISDEEDLDMDYSDLTFDEDISLVSGFISGSSDDNLQRVEVAEDDFGDEADLSDYRAFSRSIAVDEDENVYVGGNKEYLGQHDESGNIRKLNDEGGLEWENDISENGETPIVQNMHLSQDEDELVVTGSLNEEEMFVYGISADNGDENWSQEFDALSSLSISETEEGEYLVTGHREMENPDELYQYNHGEVDETDVRDITALKLDSDGEVEWRRDYGADDDLAGNVHPSDEGGFVAASSRTSYSYPKAKGDSADDAEATSVKDAVITGVDDNGSWQWDFELGRALRNDDMPENLDIIDNEDSLEGVYVQDSFDSEGEWDGYVMTAHREREDGSEDVITVGLKADDGNEEPEIAWIDSMEAENSYEVGNISATDDGGYVMTGSVEQDGNSNVWARKLNSDGSQDFYSTFTENDGEDHGNHIKEVFVDEEPHYVLTGSTSTEDFAGRAGELEGDQDQLVMMIDADGEIEWADAIGGSGDDSGESIRQYEEGRYIMTGVTSSGTWEDQENGENNGQNGEIQPDGDVSPHPSADSEEAMWTVAYSLEIDSETLSPDKEAEQPAPYGTGEIFLELDNAEVEYNWENSEVTYMSAEGEQHTDSKFGVQVGPDSSDKIFLEIDNVRTENLGFEEGWLDGDFSDEEFVSETLETIDGAIEKLSSARSEIGAFTNRLEHSLSNVENYNENLESARSRIEDADMARKLTEQVRLDILNQAILSMQAQANQQPQTVLQLLGTA